MELANKVTDFVAFLPNLKEVSWDEALFLPSLILYLFLFFS